MKDTIKGAIKIKGKKKDFIRIKDKSTKEKLQRQNYKSFFPKHHTCPIFTFERRDSAKFPVVYFKRCPARPPTVSLCAELGYHILLQLYIKP